MSYRPQKFNIFKTELLVSSSPLAPKLLFIFPISVNGTTAYPENREASLDPFSTSPLTILRQFCVLTIVQIHACVFSPTAPTLVHPTIIFYLKGYSFLLINIHIMLPPV